MSLSFPLYFTVAAESLDVDFLAEAVADGSNVDWDAAESGAGTPDVLEVVRQLRVLAAVGVAARARTVQWGYFEIRAEVGSGTFGTVYRAWDPRLEREVALKLLAADATGGADPRHARRTHARAPSPSQRRHGIRRRCIRGTCRPLDGVRHRAHPETAAR